MWWSKWNKLIKYTTKESWLGSEEILWRAEERIKKDKLIESIRYWGIFISFYLEIKKRENYFFA